MYSIPFNKPTIVGRELYYISQAIINGHSSGDGDFTKKCHSLLENALNVPKVLLTTNCTHALEMSALLLDIQPGDEVIVPSFTFVSTVNAFVLRGAVPRFIDVRGDTLNLDETLIEKLISPKTRAILPVHYAGVGCEMDVILATARAHKLAVVEDNAHGLFGKYKGKLLGTFGLMATQSFHETKNFTCGEGGALIINDPELIERAEVVREKGTNRSRFFRGMVDKYSWVNVGSSYLPSEILAAFLFAQLEARTQIQARRQEIWHYYDRHLKDWASSNGVRQPVVPPYCDQSYHMYYLLLPSFSIRQRFIEHLKKESILSVYHYLPLNISTMGLKFGGKVGDCPVTEDISDRLVRLPFFNTLTDEEQAKVVKTIMQFNFQAG